MENKNLTHKKSWQKPELIVLVRSHPEEMVLTACKGTALEGPVTLYTRCNKTNCAGTCKKSGIT